MHRGWIPVAATALALIAAAPAGAADFTTSFEASDAPPTYTNTSEVSSGVSGTKPALPGSNESSTPPMHSSRVRPTSWTSPRNGTES